MSNARRFNRRRGAVKASDLPAAAPAASAKDDSPLATDKRDSPRQELPLTRPGQSIVDALKETSHGMSEKLDKHYAGWTPNRDLVAQTHQKQKLDQDRREKDEQRAAMPALGVIVPNEAEVKEDEVKKLVEKAGEPGSIFWTPAILKSHITDMLLQLHTGEMEELLGEQIEMLRSVVTRNSNLVRWLDNHDNETKELHESVKYMVEGLEQRVEKTGRKTETTLYGCQDMGERMVALINAAFVERERVRQLLLADADIVVTEEKKALLEERRRIGHEMGNKVRIMKAQEDEIGPGGIPEPPEIADLRMRIEKKTKKQVKLKVEQETVQHRLKSLEQALQAVERGERADKIHALDQNALETIEEAKGMARKAAIAPLLEAMKRERELESPEPIEMPPELTAEREMLERQLAEVEREIEAIEDLRIDWEGMRQAAMITIQHIPDEAEKRLSLFSAKRRKSCLPMQVEPPVVSQMPPFKVEKAPNIKAGLQLRCREMHEEMEPLLKVLPKYLVLVKNAEQTAKTICEQREKFISHLRMLKPKFMKDLRYGGARKLGRQDINAKIEEEQMMKEVEDLWDEEEAKLLTGHAELQKRASFFEVMASELTEEFARLEEAVDRNRLSFKKMSLEAVDEESGEETKEPAEAEVFEAEPIYVENFLTLQEEEKTFVQNAIAAYRVHEEQILARLTKEGAEAEKEASLKIQEDLEKKRVMRDVHLSALCERRKSMAASGTPSAMSRQASKDTLAEDVSPRNSRGLSSWSLSDGNRLTLQRGSSRVQTTPRLSFASQQLSDSAGNEEAEGEAMSRQSSLASLVSTPDASQTEMPRVSRPASPAAAPAASPRAARKGTLALEHSPGKSTREKKHKGSPKKRSTRRAATDAPKSMSSASEAPDSSEDHPKRQELDDSGSDINVEGSELLQNFLKADRQNTRLEAKVRESSLRLSKMRYQLLGENASPLDLDRLKSMAGDERARALAQDSVTELRQKWQARLERGASAAEFRALDTSPQRPAEPEQRSRAEESAFQETYAKLLAQIETPVVGD